MTTAVLERLEAKREEVVALTQALVRIPTVNPPGDAYGPCAELVGERLRRRGFEVGYLRAEGTPGDTARNPRINVVARWESGLPGPCSRPCRLLSSAARRRGSASKLAFAGSRADTQRRIARESRRGFC